MTPGVLSAWDGCHPVLFVEINLRQDLSKKNNIDERMAIRMIVQLELIKSIILI